MRIKTASQVSISALTTSIDVPAPLTMFAWAYPYHAVAHGRGSLQARHGLSFMGKDNTITVEDHNFIFPEGDRVMPITAASKFIFDDILLWTCGSLQTGSKLLGKRDTSLGTVDVYETTDPGLLNTEKVKTDKAEKFIATIATVLESNL